MKTYEFGNEYRLRPLDKRNWQLQQWREVTDKRTGVTTTKWVDCGRYYQSVLHALEDAAEMVSRVNSLALPDEIVEMRQLVEDHKAVLQQFRDTFRELDDGTSN